MGIFFVNKKASSNGDHEVHTSECSYMPEEQNQQLLGDFSNCADAVQEARKFYDQVNGCYVCSKECNKE